MEELVQWQELSTGLWFSVVVETNPLASLKAVASFLDSLKWRLHASITEEEFTVLFLEWRRSGKSRPHYLVREPGLDVSLEQFRALMVMKGLSDCGTIQQMLGLLVNECNRAELALGYFSAGWLALLETLFFALDVTGKGFISAEDLLWLVLSEQSPHGLRLSETTASVVQAKSRHRLSEFGARRSPLETPYCGRVSLFCFKQHVKRCASKLDSKHPFNQLSLQKMLARLQRFSENCDTTVRPSREAIIGVAKGKLKQESVKVLLWAADVVTPTMWAQEIDQAKDVQPLLVERYLASMPDSRDARSCLQALVDAYSKEMLRALAVLVESRCEDSSTSSSESTSKVISVKKEAQSADEEQSRYSALGSLGRSLSGNNAGVSDDASVRRSESVVGHAVEERNDYTSVYSQAMRLFQEENSVSDDDLVWQWEQAPARVRQLFLLLVQAKDTSPKPLLSGSGFTSDTSLHTLDPENVQEVDVDQAVESLLRYSISNTPLQLLGHVPAEGYPTRFQQTLSKGNLQVQVNPGTDFDVREVTLIIKESKGGLEGILLSSGKPRVHISMANAQVMSDEKRVLELTVSENSLKCRLRFKTRHARDEWLFILTYSRLLSKTRNAQMCDVNTVKSRETKDSKNTIAIHEQIPVPGRKPPGVPHVNTEAWGDSKNSEVELEDEFEDCKEY